MPGYSLIQSIWVSRTSALLCISLSSLACLVMHSPYTRRLATMMDMLQIPITYSPSSYLYSSMHATLFAPKCFIAIHEFCATYMGTQLQHLHDVYSYDHRFHCDCSSEERTLFHHIAHYPEILDQSLVQRQLWKGLWLLQREQSSR